MMRRECSVAWQQPSGPDCKWFSKSYAAIWAMQNHITLKTIVNKQCCALSEGTNKHLISKWDVISWIGLNFSTMIRRQISLNVRCIHHIIYIWYYMYYIYVVSVGLKLIFFQKKQKVNEWPHPNHKHTFHTYLTARYFWLGFRCSSLFIKPVGKTHKHRSKLIRHTHTTRHCYLETEMTNTALWDYNAAVLQQCVCVRMGVWGQWVPVVHTDLQKQQLYSKYVWMKPTWRCRITHTRKVQMETKSCSCDYTFSAFKVTCQIQKCFIIQA